MSYSEELFELEQLRRLKAAYFRLIDTKRWSLWSDLLTEDCVMSFGSGTHGTLRGRDAIVESVSMKLADAVSVHRGFLPEIDIRDGGTATAIWAMTSDLIFTTPTGTVGQTGSGHYFDEYRRSSDGRWRIAGTRLTKILRVISDPNAAASLAPGDDGVVIRADLFGAGPHGGSTRTP